jgi:lysophospholipase L1-like esterase
MCNLKNSITFLLTISYIALSGGCSGSQEMNSEQKRLNKNSLRYYAHPDRWKEDIQKFVDNDKQTAPVKNAVLFIGSSSIRGWNTQKWFPEIPTINRGFGGSYVIDSFYYADQIIIPYKPKTIVFYAGDNDTVDTKPSGMILADLKSLIFKVRRALPKTKIIIISIKPSIDRWKFWPQMVETNSYIEDYCKYKRNIYFVDISKVMLDSSGQPRKDIYMADGLHINETGYKLWTSLVKPLINQ